MRIEILSDVAVSRNLAGKDDTVTCAYPQATVLGNGDAVSLYRQGREKHSHDGILVMQTSSDKGTSWSEPRTVFDGRQLQPTKAVVSGGICQTTAGTLLATFSLVEGLNPGVYLFSEEGNTLRLQVCAIRSEDGGSTWSEPEAIDFTPFPKAGITTKPFVLPGGEICVPIEVQTSGGPQGTAAVFSSDDGKSFTPHITYAADPSGQLNLCDARFTTLKDGRLLMLLWVFLQDTEETIEVRRAFSSDQGRTWTTPEPVGMLGQIVVPLALPSGDVIAASTYRQPPEGIRLWLSRDGGVSWDAANSLQMWDPERSCMVGEPGAQSLTKNESSDIWQALAGFTYGTPDLVALGDGSVLLTYYATIDGVIHVRACRFRLCGV